MKGNHVRCALLGLLLLLMGWSAEAASFFLAEGEEVPHTRTITVYVVDVATKQVRLSKVIPGVVSKLLSRDKTRLFTTDDSTVYEFTGRDLALQKEHKFELGYSAAGQDYFFVHPHTGSFYFTGSGSTPNKVFIVHPTNPSKVKRLWAPLHPVERGFAFDPKREWVYVDSTTLFAIDPKTLRIAFALDLEKLLGAPPFALRQARTYKTFLVSGAKLFPLTDGTLLLYPRVEPAAKHLPPIPPMLLLYDPDRHTLVRHSESIPALQVAALSRDGSRLFASTSTTAGPAAVIDTHTLAVLHTPSFPEPAEQLVPAPDGQGMWLVGESGKVYRLDEQTGNVVEQVTLLVRLRRIITGP